MANKRTNLGKIYLEKTYINNTNIVKANTTWFTKKKGTNWGIINKKLKIVFQRNLIKKYIVMEKCK